MIFFSGRMVPSAFLGPVVHGRHAQARADALAEHLPRNDVRVVLEGADEDLVARFEMRLGPTACHQVDGLGGVAQHHDLSRVGGAEEVADFFACVLVALGRLGGEPVDPPMNVGVARAIEVIHRLEDLPGLLGRSGRVEKDEALASGARGAALVQDGEVAPQCRDIERADMGGRRIVGRRHGWDPPVWVISSKAGHPFAQRRGRQGARDLGREAARQQGPGLARSHGPRSQVEESLFVELADARAVAALHVVGVDLELGLGVDLGPLAEQQVRVRLQCIGLGRLGAHEHTAAEDAPRILGQHSLVELPARAVGRRVVDQGVVVDVLPGGGEEEPVQVGFRARLGQERGEFIAHQRAAQRQGVRGEAAVASLGHLKV